ncbi:myosin 2 [Martiniozyma asiatica (nom. inval.)]|nr:myosin 2 [Martiniozyma asiatica]
MSSALFFEGSLGWIPDKDQGFIPVKIKNVTEENSKFKLELIDDNNPKNELSPVIVNSIEDETADVLYKRKRDEKVDDLTTLSYLNDPSVLNAIKMRYNQSDIYTSSGIVLIAVNPFERRDALYSHNMISSYAGSKRGELEPHLFAIAEDAYRSMKTYSKDQSIVVSGESGAGKTVSAKYIMRYFATVDSDNNQHDMSDTEKQILATNPITEAFGNAKTTRNDNSSRFGKYLKILFDEGKVIAGAEIKTYLLERSRLVYQQATERNYHIFYQMFAGLNDAAKAEFGLSSIDDFFYVNQGKQPEIAGVDDKQEFEDTCSALSMVGITEEQQHNIFKVLSGLLHLGNIEIKNSKGKPAHLGADEPNLAKAAELLGLDPNSLASSHVKFKATAGRTTIQREYNSDQALNARDALAKFIYHNLFDWLVLQINKVLSPQDWPEWSSYEPTPNQPRKNFIGVLDIYGFEHFKVNSFEQFCINYANEKLQQEFIHRMFTLELQDYEREGIGKPDLPFDDNKACIDLIESKPGILALLDDESKMPQGNDDTWEQNMNQILEKKDKYSKPKMGRGKFIVSHYALDVQYSTNSFVDKNRDSVSDTQREVLTGSSNNFLTEVLAVNEKPDEEPKPGKRPSKPTLGGKFKKSLNELMTTINGSDVHYIRCIKPNEQKEAWVFDDQMVMSQLRACGVLASIQIYCQGFPSKMKFPEFANNFAVLVFSHEQRSKLMQLTSDEIRECINNFLKETIQDESLFSVGKTKVFFKAGVIGKIETIKADKQKSSAIIIQKFMRAHSIRKQYQESMEALNKLQALCKGVLTRKRIQEQLEMESAILIQSALRGSILRKKYNNAITSLVSLQATLKGQYLRGNIHKEIRKQAAVTLQSVARGFLARNKAQKFKHATIFTQSMYRKNAAKKEYLHMKEEAKSVTKLNDAKLGLEQKVIDLTKSIGEKATENLNLQQQIISLQSLVQKNTNEHQELMSKHTELQSLHDSKVGDYETSVNELNKEIENLKAEYDDARSKVDELTESSLKLRDELKENIEQLDKARNALAESQDENTTLAGKVEQLEHELKELQDHLNSGKFNNTTLGTVSTGGQYMSFNESRHISSGNEGNEDEEDEYDIESLNQINRELISLLEGTQELHKEIVQGMFRMIDMPEASAASKPTKKEIMFPSRICVIILSDMWRLGMTDVSEKFVGEILTCLQQIAKDMPLDNIIKTGAFWLTNVHELYCFVCYAQSTILNVPDLTSQMGETEYAAFVKLVADAKEDFESLSFNIYNIWIKRMMSTLENMIIPAVVLTQSLPGFMAPESSPLLSKMWQQQPKYNMDNILSFFTEVYWAMKCYHFEDEVVETVIIELLKFINAYCFNDLIMRRNFLSWKRGLQLNYNVTRLEEWVKGHGIKNGALYLSHLFQVSKLLQLRKNTGEDVDTIYEICHSLKPIQIQKLFSQYHVADYETPISPMISQALADRVKQTGGDSDYFEVINKSSLFDDPFRKIGLRPFSRVEAYIPARLNVPVLRRLVELSTLNADIQDSSAYLEDGEDDTIALVAGEEQFPVKFEVIKVSKYINNLVKNLQNEDYKDSESEGEDDEPEPIEIPIQENDPPPSEGEEEEEEEEEEDNEIKPVLLEPWERRFLDTDSKTIQNIIMAANYLNIKPLQNASCRFVAEMVRGCSPKEIIEAFNAVQAANEANNTK